MRAKQPGRQPLLAPDPGALAPPSGDPVYSTPPAPLSLAQHRHAWLRRSGHNRAHGAARRQLSTGRSLAGGRRGAHGVEQAQPPPRHIQEAAKPRRSPHDRRSLPPHRGVPVGEWDAAAAPRPVPRSGNTRPLQSKPRRRITTKSYPGLEVCVVPAAAPPRSSTHSAPRRSPLHHGPNGAYWGDEPVCMASWAPDGKAARAAPGREWGTLRPPRAQVASFCAGIRCSRANRAPRDRRISDQSAPWRATFVRLISRECPSKTGHERRRVHGARAAAERGAVADATVRAGGLAGWAALYG